MKTRSVEINHEKKLGQVNTFNVEITKQILVFVLSLLVSNYEILGILSPFGVALFASLPKNLFYTSFVGSILGYSFLGLAGSSFVQIFDSFQTLPNIFALILILILKMAMSSYKPKVDKVVFLSVASFLAMLFSNLTVLLFNRFSFFNLLIAVSGSFLVGSMTYFCSISLKCIRSKRVLSHLNIFEKSSMIIVGVVILLSLCNIQFWFLNLGRILGIVIILCVCYKYGFVGGAITGILVSLAITLYNPNLVVVAGSFIVAGFIAGLFNHFGKLLTVSIFIIVNAVAFILLKADTYMVMSIIDMLIASVAFICIPESLYEKIIINTGAKGSVESVQMNSNISSKLEFASKTISDLQNSVETVSKKIDTITQMDINNIFESTTDKVCKRCGLNMVCWDTNYADTVNSLNKTARLLRANGRISNFDIPYYFQKKCCKLDELVDNINKSYKSYVVKETTTRRVTEVRNIAIEQFEAMAEMLCEISKEIGEVSRFDDRMAVLVRQIFENNSVRPNQVCCLIDKYGKICIDVYMYEELRVDPKILATQISDCMRREFDVPSVMTVKGQTKISFFESANFFVDFYAIQIPCKDGEVCGDSYEYFSDSKGFAHIILSDGMGSGKKAAIDSVMTCSLVLNLIKAGFGFESALKLINSSLLVKSKEESIATLDIATIDLYTGKVYFNKAGAASSFVYKNNKILKINSGSLPIGILKGVAFDKKSLSISDDSIIIMVSDGVIATGTDWIESELSLHKKKAAKDIANIICKEAKRRLSDGRSDDMTVIVSKIKHSKII